MDPWCTDVTVGGESLNVMSRGQTVLVVSNLVVVVKDILTTSQRRKADHIPLVVDLSCPGISNTA